MKYCPKCGKENSNECNACIRCGYSLAYVVQSEKELTPPTKPKIISIVVSSTIAVFFFALTIYFASKDDFALEDYSWLSTLIVAIISCIIVVFNINSYAERKEAYDLWSTDAKEYPEYVEHKRKEREEREKRLYAQEQERVAEKYNYYRYKCPMCGSNKIMNISTAKKTMSAQAWGLGSKTIGRLYVCADCKYMW